MWTAPTCRSFPTGRHVCQWESGDMSRAVLRVEHAFKGHSDCRLDAGAGREDVHRMPDQLLPQTPPGVPAPAAGEATLNSRRKFWWMIGIGGGLVILLFAYLALALRERQRYMDAEAINEALSNARQIGLALSKFESEYGKYPDRTTAAALRQETDTVFTLLDSTSNDIFSQLLVYGTVDDERLFFAEAKSMRRPDNVFHSDATILEHGECAFAYVSGLSSIVDPKTPLVFGPVIPGTKKFDAEANDGEVVVLLNDNSVRSLPINSAGKIIVNGLDFLDPRQPYWNGKTPDVKWPK